MSGWKKGLPCEVVKDVLPLYVDEIVNDVTAGLVREHIEGCDSCRQEYQMYRDEVPKMEEKRRTTKEKFDDTMIILKKKQIRNIALTVFITCAVMILAYVVTSVPLIPMPDSEFQVERVYRFEEDGEEKFFVVYTEPSYYTAEGGSVVTEQKEDGSVVVKLQMKRTIWEGISRKNRREYNNESLSVGSKCDKLYWGDTLIWSVEENGKDEVPEYVYEYGSRDLAMWEMFWDEGYVGIIYTDGREVHWDLDGNVIYEGQVVNSDSDDRMTY